LEFGLGTMEDLRRRPSGQASAADCRQQAHGFPEQLQLGRPTLTALLHLIIYFSSASLHLHRFDSSTTWEHAAIVLGLRVS
jgi:hypothetical protein